MSTQHMRAPTFIDIVPKEGARTHTHTSRDSIAAAAAAAAKSYGIAVCRTVSFHMYFVYVCALV